MGSERYKALNDGSRAVYEAKYKQAVEQYGKDMSAFLAAGGKKKLMKLKKSKYADPRLVRKENETPAEKRERRKLRAQLRKRKAKGEDDEDNEPKRARRKKKKMTKK